MGRKTDPSAITEENSCQKWEPGPATLGTSLIMNILILGGTVFVGRAIAEAALKNGHQVSVFHRGTKGTGIVPGATDILGDRDGGLAALGDTQWDVVVDSCGYFPRVVKDACDYLKDKTKRFVFISTISVYEEDGQGGLREPKPTERLTTEEVNGETYGPLKLECEEDVREVFGDRATIIRPGIIAGPHDPTNRFPYWVGRMAAGEKLLVPSVEEASLQLIDAGDLGAFTVKCMEENLSDTYDTPGPFMTFGTMIKTIHDLYPNAQLCWKTEEELADKAVLWKDLPLALPKSNTGALMRIDPTKALQAGLVFTPLEVTAQNTQHWLATDPEAGTFKYGMTRERELELLTELGC